MASYAVRQVEFTALTLTILGAILLLAVRYPRALAGVLALASIEMVGYARSCLDHFPLQDILTAPDARFSSAHAAGSLRVNDAKNPNLAMSMGGYDLWGYDPGVLRRYAEWIAASQGLDPDGATETVELHRVPAVYASLLRARGLVPLDRPPSGGGQPITVSSVAVPPAPRLMLVPHARVVPERNEQLAAIFDPKLRAVAGGTLGNCSRACSDRFGPGGHGPAGG